MLKTLLLMMSIISTLWINSAFAAFLPPNPQQARANGSAFVGGTTTLTYTLRRSNPTGERITGLRAGAIAPGIISPSLGGTCINVGVAGEPSCTLILTYTPKSTTVSPTPEQASNITVFVNGGIPFPVPPAPNLSFSVEIVSSFLIIPSDVPPLRLPINAGIDQPVELLFHLSREVGANTIDSANTILPSELKIKSGREGNSCLEAGTPLSECTLTLIFTPSKLYPRGFRVVEFTLLSNRKGPVYGYFEANVPEITSVLSIATSENSGPAEGQTGIEILGTGFDALPKNIKLQFAYGAGKTADLSLVTIVDDEHMTANTPAFPATTPGLPLPSRPLVSLTLLNTTTVPDGVQLAKTEDIFRYRAARCTPSAKGDPSECVAQLKACVSVSGPSQEKDRFVTVKAQKPNKNICVDSLPKFEPILIPAKRTEQTFCTTNTYRFVADRVSDSCKNYSIERLPQLDITYEGTSPIVHETMRVAMNTRGNIFRLLTIPSTKYCITNIITPDIDSYPRACTDPLFSRGLNAYFAVNDFRNEQSILMLVALPVNN